MEKIKKIEIKSRPKEDKSGYEVTIETPQKFDEVVCNSRAEKNGFLKGFETAVEFFNLAVALEIQDYENLKETKTNQPAKSRAFFINLTPTT